MTAFIPPPGPRRLLYLSVATRGLGFALWTTISVLYYTRVVGLSPGEVAAGLTLAGLAGLAAGPLVGRLADRRGIREITLVVYTLQVAGPLLALFVSDFVTFVGVAVLVSASLAVSQGLSRGLVGYLAGDQATTLRAQNQTISQVTGCAGMAVPAIALHLDTPGAYRTMIALCALFLAASPLLIARLPHLPPVAAPSRGARAALRDLPYLAVCVICGVLYTTVAISEVVLPLWIVRQTSAPPWTLSVVLVVASVALAVLTVPFTARVTSLTQGGRALVRGGATALAAFALIGLSSGMPAPIAFCLLLMGVALIALAELWVMAGEFALSYGLAPAHAQAEYQSVLSVAQSLAVAITPGIAVPLIDTGGIAGWLTIGLIFTLAGALAPLAVRLTKETV
ncbi:MFS transporter [Nonomuraea sp. NPDC050556]|uniref:MFS transporter n=1 Tax=Nonomuraea sp. NPDC050556 TaxID=3364369 RepID=UPI0037AC9A3E